MALNNSQYERIMRIYSDRQFENAKRRSEIKSRLYNEHPRLQEIDECVASESLKASKEALSGNLDAMVSLRTRVDALKKEKEDILRKAGYSLKDLEPQYSCPYCKDTGFIGGKPCRCFKQMVIDTVYARSRLSEVLDKENFDTFNLDFYSKDITNEDNVSSYDNALSVLNKCKDFCDNFKGDENILLYGSPGVGKTFLTHCIARSLLDNMHSVLYLTADELVRVFETETFDKEEAEGFESRAVYDVEVLIIDDLGTEFVNSFTSAKIFTCINERLLRGKSTIISTNLSLQDLLDIYSERTFSRISQFRILKLFGSDIRIMKQALSD